MSNQSNVSNGVTPQEKRSWLVAEISNVADAITGAVNRICVTEDSLERSSMILSVYNNTECLKELVSCRQNNFEGIDELYERYYPKPSGIKL